MYDMFQVPNCFFEHFFCLFHVFLGSAMKENIEKIYLTIFFLIYILILPWKHPRSQAIFLSLKTLVGAGHVAPRIWR
jgi:hypothetical protein